MAPTPKPVDPGVEVGQVFLGKYRVDAILGHGGMGIVAQCHHLQLDERVAIKMLRPDVLSDLDAVSRFVREAQAAAKLKSEYVAKVTDVGELENGVPFMVMEFLDGLDLGQMLEEQGTLGVPLVADLMLQACEALTEAHTWGIVHRDVKPTNLFVTWRAEKPVLKVLDFGISKTRAGADMQLTQTQSLLGTPAYMSPEQMRSAREVDWRSDIWSLGTVMYEAIEGHRPFEAESFSEMCVKVAVDPPTTMRHAPPQLQPILLRCLAKTPDERYASMADLARELIPFAPDPHSAQMLVERMYRMLRRSQTNGDWAASSGTNESRVPAGIREDRSSPVMQQQQQWQEPSRPVMQPWPAESSPHWPGGSTPAAQPYQPDPNAFAAASHPAVSMPAMAGRPLGQTTYVTTPKPSRLKWVVLAGLLVAAGTIALAFALNSGPTEKTPIQMQVEPPTKVEPPAKVETPAKVDDGKKDDPVVVDVKKDDDGKKPDPVKKPDDGKKKPHDQTPHVQHPPPTSNGTGTGSAKPTQDVKKTDPLQQNPAQNTSKQDVHCADGSLVYDHKNGCPKPQ